MKQSLKVFSASLAAVLIGMVAMAQEVGVAGAKIEIAEKIMDFGTVGQGEALIAKFMIKNIGTEDLVIHSVRPTCGCTVADYTESIAPGETGWVNATVDTTRFSGPITKSVLISTSDTSTPSSNLVVKANIQPHLEVLPRPLVRFNAIQGEPSVQKVTVVSDSEEDFEITEIASNVDFVGTSWRKLEGEELLKGHTGNQYEVSLELMDNAPIGPINAKLELRTNHPEAPKMEIKAFGVVRALLHVTPAQIQFGEVEAMVKPGRNVVFVNNQEGKQVQITGVSLDDQAFAAEIFTIEEGRRYQVTVTLNDSAELGAHSTELQIETDDPAQPIVTVPVTATVK